VRNGGDGPARAQALIRQPQGTRRSHLPPEEHDLLTTGVFRRGRVFWRCTGHWLLLTMAVLSARSDLPGPITWLARLGSESRFLHVGCLNEFQNLVQQPAKTVWRPHRPRNPQSTPTEQPQRARCTALTDIRSIGKLSLWSITLLADGQARPPCRWCRSCAKNQKASSVQG